MLFPNIIDIFQNEINVSELKNFKMLMESPTLEPYYHNAVETARESAATLSEKMTETYRQVLQDLYSIPESAPYEDDDIPPYKAAISTDGTLTPVSAVASHEVEDIISSENIEKEPLPTEEADALEDCGFPDIPENILIEFGVSQSPLKKKTRSGIKYGGNLKKKTKKTKKSKKVKRKSRKV